MWLRWIASAWKNGGDAGLGRASAGKYTYSLGVELSGGRSAAGAMQRKRIAWAGVLRYRRKPGNDLGSVAEVQPGRCQRRHVQRLADMASVIGPLCVLMEERSARRKINQCNASQQRQRTAQRSSPEIGFPQSHLSTLNLSTLDGRTTRMVALYELTLTTRFQS